ncbi:MAG: ABC transporter permease [Cyclobacteriaceae bacterium]|jgi:putative ABC transport system permease protein
MLKFYTTIALRRLLNHKLSFFLNITSLFFSIAISLIIYSIVSREYSFEDQWKDSESIHRVVATLNFSGQEVGVSGVPEPLATVLQNSVVEIRDVATFYLFEPNLTTVDNQPMKKFKSQKGIIFADERYFKMFDHTWILGDERFLVSPFQVVLTKGRAKQYFPQLELADIIGQKITYEDSLEVVVAGIVNDIDHATDFDFKEFISLNTAERGSLREYFSVDNWSSFNSSVQLFVKLIEPDKKNKIESQLSSLLVEFIGDDLRNQSFSLQPLKDMHFNHNFDLYFKSHGNKDVLKALILLGIFAVLIGCINYINLTTSKQIHRLKEIGIYKTFGSTSKQIILQFLVETYIITIVAASIAIFALYLFKEYVINIVPLDFEITISFNYRILAFILIIITLTGFLAGLWPSLILAKLKPVQLLNLKTHLSLKHGRKVSSRHALIIFQFVIAQFLLVSTIVVFSQTQFLFKENLGHDTENILLIPTPKTNYLTHRAFAKALESLTAVSRVSVGAEPPTSTWYNSTTLTFGSNGVEKSTHVELKYADAEFIDLYNIRVSAGRNLSPTTKEEILINETYCKILGFGNPRDCIGQQIGRKQIVGVIQDFNTKSLHSRIGPVVLMSDTSQVKYYHILLAHAEIQATLNMIRNLWKDFFSDNDFSYHIYSEQLNALYSHELKTSKMMTYSSVLVILINCLGLFGLITFNTNKRAKEIAIRKINGATTFSIINLLTKDFLGLIAIGLIISSPIAWYFLKDWLYSFAYHVIIDWKFFVFSGLILILITYITISFKSVSAAQKNPIEFLRNSE